MRYKGLVGGKIPLCHNIFKVEPLDIEGLMRKSFLASIRCALKTTNEPLDVNYVYLYIVVEKWELVKWEIPVKCALNLACFLWTDT